MSTARRMIAVLHAVFAVTRRHAPKWLVIALGVALAIPGPVDELIVLVMIAVLVAVKPVMRADMAAAVRAAWATAPVGRRSHTGTRTLVALAASVAVLLAAPMIAPAVAVADGVSVIGHGRHAARCANVGGIVVCRPIAGAR